MSLQGPNSGTTFVNDSGVGSYDWSNPGNAQYSDDIYAVATGNGDSHYLKATGFGFSIPVEAKITGIVVEVEGHIAIGWPTNPDNLDYIRLVKGGTIQGINVRNTSYWTLTDQYFSQGGYTNLWGLTLTPADVNASNFGVAVSISIYENDTAYLDHIRMTVYYKPIARHGYVNFQNPGIA